MLLSPEDSDIHPEHHGPTALPMQHAGGPLNAASVTKIALTPTSWLWQQLQQGRHRSIGASQGQGQAGGAQEE